jgi:uncharacterized protein (TIGR02147 family)
VASQFLIAASEKCHVTEFLNYREYLLAVFEHLKRELDSYSYKKFSQDLELSPDNASWLIITGRRKISPSVCLTIIKEFGLKNIERQYFEILVKHNNARKEAEQETLMQKLVELRGRQIENPEIRNKLQYFSKWYYPIIREMVGLSEFVSDPTWITKKLQCRLLPAEVQESLALLESLGLIEFDPSRGRHVQRGGDITPSAEIDGIAAMRFHQMMLQLAGLSLGAVTDEDYDINALTLRLSLRNFEKAQKILGEAFLKIYRLESVSSEDERLYQANFQLFPLTKLAGTKRSAK